MLFIWKLIHCIYNAFIRKELSVQFPSRSLGILKYSTLEFLFLRLKIHANLAMFGEAKRVLQNLELRDKFTPLSGKDF